MKTENIALGILVLLIIGIVLISGCVQEEAPGFVEKECRIKEDCPDKTCFAKACVDYECSYSEITPCCGNEICEIGESFPECAECPNCNDNDKCTEDSFDYEQQACVNEKIVPCCGNGICEAEETYLTCLEDCPKTYEDELEEKIPEIKEYPKLEQVFVDLYSFDGFTDSEIKYIKSLFEIFKSKTDLHQADEEVLAYLVTDTTHIELSKSRAMDMEYFVEEVIPLANDITKGSSGEMESIEKIVSWTRENIKVNWTAIGLHNGMPKGILEYKEVPTACSYYSTLITALCRASGIPAREVGGSFGYSGSGHGWVEAYVNGEWVMVESTGYLESNPGKKNWLHSVYTYDPLNDRLMDVSLSYNTGILNLIIEHTKESVGETSAIKQAEEIFAQYEKEKGLAKKYSYAQEIMDICISEIIAKQEGYESEDIKVLDLWDWDKLKTDEAFLSELEKAKAISVYDVTAKDFIQYRTFSMGSEEFPLKKINTTIPEIKQLFQGKIYFFLAHYKADYDPLSDAVTITLFNPEDVDTLETAYQNLLTGTPELLKNFVTEIASVVSKEKNYATFHLPEYIREGTEYSIVTSSKWDMENTAWNIFFQIQSTVTIQDIVMVFRADQTTIMVNLPDLTENIKTALSKWSGFDNLKLINKEGKVYVDPEIYRNPQFNPNDNQPGVPYDCAPSSVFISPGQTIEIYSENDIVIIKGDITTERIVVS